MFNIGKNEMKFIRFVAFAAIMACGSSLHAGVFGSSILQVTNAKVQFFDTTTSTWEDATLNEIAAGTSSVTLKNVAELDGTEVGSPAAGTTYIFPGVADEAQAFITAGTDVPPAENFFATSIPSSTSAFGRADSLATGSLIGPGYNVSTVAEMEALNLSTGSAGGSSGAFAVFDLNVLQSGDFRLIFDADLTLNVDSDGPPLDRLVTASSSLTVQINGNSIDLSGTDGTLTRTIMGTDTFTNVQKVGIVTDAISLKKGTLKTLSFNTGSTVSIGVVPEPTSALVFLSLGAVGFIRRRS